MTAPVSDAPTAHTPTYAPVKHSIYTVLVVLMVSLLLISNICATKGVTLFPDLGLKLGFIDLSQGLPTDGAFFLFPLTYIIGDVLSEVYGFKATRRAVLTSFAVTLLAAVAFSVTIALPGAEWYENQAALESTVGVVPQILLASMCGFVAGELVNSKVLVAMKQRTGEKGLWGRLISSTIVGEFADTLAFGIIAAGAIGLVENTVSVGLFQLPVFDASSIQVVAAFVIVGFIWKSLVEIVFMPLTVLAIGWIKKREPEYTPA